MTKNKSQINFNTQNSKLILNDLYTCFVVFVIESLNFGILFVICVLSFVISRSTIRVLFFSEHSPLLTRMISPSARLVRPHHFGK